MTGGDINKCSYLEQSRLSNEFSKDAIRLNSALDQVARKQRVEYYTPLGSRIPIVGGLAVLFKRIIRKLTKHLLIPIVDQQNEFNAGVRKYAEESYKHEIVSQQVLNIMILKMREQEEKNHQLENEITEMKKRLAAGERSLE